MLWIGITCSGVGNILNSISYQFQLCVHANNTNNVAYIMCPMWWAGLVCMIAGEIGNLAAYGMAPVLLVSPLGAVSMISNAVLSRVILKEKSHMDIVLKFS